MIRKIVVVPLSLALALTACDEPNDDCTEEGKKKHYSTGQILSCENGKWELRRGVGFER